MIGISQSKQVWHSSAMRNVRAGVRASFARSRSALCTSPITDRASATSLCPDSVSFTDWPWRFTTAAP